MKPVCDIGHISLQKKKKMLPASVCFSYSFQNALASLKLLMSNLETGWLWLNVRPCGEV